MRDIRIRRFRSNRPGARASSGRRGLRRIAWIAAGLAMPALAARIECDEPVFDFGERPETEIVTHVFHIRNAGQHELQIHGFRETCVCMAARAADWRIPPGAGSAIEVRLSLRGRRGRQRHHVEALSSDPRTPRLRLTMTGLVRADVALRPPHVFLGRVSREDGETRTVELIVSGDRPVRVRNVSSEAEWVAARFLPGADASGAGRIELRFRTPLPAGLIHTSIRIETDHPGAPVLTLPVGAYVRDPAAQPARSEL